MEPQYIVAISAGGIFLLLLMIYLIRYYKAYQKKKNDKVEMQYVYSERNLKKIDYDLAFFEGTERKTDINTSDEEKAEIAKAHEQALYAKPNGETQKPVEGHFKP